MTAAPAQPAAVQPAPANGQPAPAEAPTPGLNGALTPGLIGSPEVGELPELPGGQPSGPTPNQREQALAVRMALQQRMARDEIFLDLLTKVIRFPITVGRDALPGEVKPLQGNWITLVPGTDWERRIKL